MATKKICDHCHEEIIPEQMSACEVSIYLPASGLSGCAAELKFEACARCQRALLKLAVDFKDEGKKPSHERKI